MSVFRDVVAAHHGESDAVLVAGRDPCIAIARDEVARVKGRRFRIVAPTELASLRLRRSWIVAVLLCKGDDTAAMADWAVAGNRDPRRVLFYLHPATDARRALAALHEAGLAVHSTWTIRNWRELHRHFSAAWNVRVFDDFR